MYIEKIRLPSPLSYVLNAYKVKFTAALQLRIFFFPSLDSRGSFA